MKNKMKNKSLLVSVAAFGMFLLLINFASAFAVGSRYWEENPILANPGETVDFFVVLQNIAGEGGDVNVEGALTEGGDIAKFTGDSQTYFVAFGAKENVDLSVTIPANATIGEVTDIVVSFKIISGEGSDALGLGSSIERTIPVKVVEEVIVEEPAEKGGIPVWVWVIIVALVIVVFWIYKKRSK